MNLWERLLVLFGIHRRTGRRYYEMDDALHLALVKLADQENRPPEELQAELLSTALAQRLVAGDLVRRWESLSPREQDVTAMTCLEYTNRQMAARLGVSEETIKTHIRNALVKFNLHGKSELRMALREWDFSAWEK
jgi:DNA-binding CsgD family transcriptional regulator